MSNQELPAAPAGGACCAPLVAEALTAETALDLAHGFKALGDPVRLRLLSLIAARAGDEVCVCEPPAASASSAHLNASASPGAA